MDSWNKSKGFKKGSILHTGFVNLATKPHGKKAAPRLCHFSPDVFENCYLTQPYVAGHAGLDISKTQIVITLLGLYASAGLCVAVDNTQQRCRYGFQKDNSGELAKVSFTFYFIKGRLCKWWAAQDDAAAKFRPDGRILLFFF